MSKTYTKSQLNNEEKIVEKNLSKKKIEKTIFPHNVLVGVDHNEYRSALTVQGQIFSSGSMHTSGSMHVAGSIHTFDKLEAAGSIFSGGSLEITGSVKVGELSIEPSAPIDGTGGFLYAKSDGKPYWRSYEMTETLMAPGIDYSSYAIARVAVTDGNLNPPTFAERQFIMITSTSGVKIRYVLIDDVTSNVATGKLIQSGDDYGSGTFTGGDDELNTSLQNKSIAVNAGTNSMLGYILGDIAAAINHANGHNAGVENSVIEVSVPGTKLSDGEQTMILKLKVAGSAGAIRLQTNITNLKVEGFATEAVHAATNTVVSGTLTLASEYSFDPTKTTDGRGYLFTKTDGHLYWTSGDKGPLPLTNDNITNSGTQTNLIGDLKVGGDDIRDSGNNVVLSFDGSGNIDSTLSLKKSSTDTFVDPEIYFRRSNTAGLEGDDALGTLWFMGSENNVDYKSGAAIMAQADGTWVPGNDGDHEKSRITFWTNGADSASDTVSERMRISSEGKVGIGTASPSHKLDVNGDIRVRGNDIRDNSGNPAITMDGSAHVTIPNSLRVTNQPCFGAYTNANQTIPANTVTRVNWDRELFDIGSNFDHDNVTVSSRGIFTAPYSGRYLFTGTIEFNDIDADAINYITSTLVLAGHDHRILVVDPDQFVNVDEDYAESFAIIAQMDANDTAYIVVESNGAGVIMDNSTPIYGSSFQGYFLG